jgi:hypothetical protein
MPRSVIDFRIRAVGDIWPAAPVRMPISAIIPPTRTALIERSSVPGPPTSITRSTPAPSERSSTAWSQSGVCR